MNNDGEEFQFAVVSDRTGGHRAKVFSRAVEQLNLLQPEFVVSVGDLIEGYTENLDQVNKEWREFQTYTSRLQMPFFYVPGNHDVTNLPMEKLWKEKFGRRYYDFVYRNVLFLVLSTEDPPADRPYGEMSPAQVEFVSKSLAANKDVRWTLVFMHKPIWTAPDLAKTGWLDVEKLLGDRPYTVFAGHIHKYQKFVRNGRNYYQLSTTGGASKMRGMPYGEFDHIVWVTMKKDGPLLANIMLDGVLPENLRTIETAEEGDINYYRRPTYTARGKVYFEGQPVPQAYVVFQSTAKERPPRADAMTEADGSFVLSTYTANDGAPVSEYAVTVVWRKPFWDESGKPGPNHLPPVYATAKTTPLRAVVKSGVNEVTFELSKSPTEGKPGNRFSRQLLPLPLWPSPSWWARASKPRRRELLAYTSRVRRAIPGPACA
jgi:3',5'-cyclic AMP phosphodiesterase CpdA